MSLIMRVDGKFNMQEVNCISIFLDQFCESIYVKRSIALSLPRQSSLVPQCKMAFNRYTRNPVGGGGLPHLAPLSYRILIYRRVNRFNFFFCITQRCCLFATLFIYVVQVPLFICRNYLGRSDYFWTNQETKKTFFTSILKGLVALI